MTGGDSLRAGARRRRHSCSNGVISWTAAILAGGRARRLGGTDKGALHIGARSILETQLSLLGGLTSEILIVAGPGRTAPDGIRVVSDREPGAGALGGLHTALLEAQTDQVLVLACDMPFLTAPFLMCLIDRGRHLDAAVPRDAAGRLHPLCASYSTRTADHFASRIAERRLRIADSLAGLHVCELGPEDLARFDRDGRLLMNVNTPEDYALARRLYADDERAFRPPA